jgi:VIT1/CCC1 family predicted Fe2+/Mn2+ transporter
MSRPITSELQKLQIGEGHLIGRIGWLRAAVLGANDGIVSTASLLVGIAAADATRENVLLAGVAGLVAGALSMAAGEYISVSSQADTERADLALEREHLTENRAYEEQELAAIYVGRGVEPALAKTVAQQLMAHDALGAHARDELGLSEMLAARPLQAALASAGSFALGASLPILTAMLSARDHLIYVVSGTCLVCLAILGALAARAGGASAWIGAARVTFWSALAMVATALVGRLFGTTVT